MTKQLDMLIRQTAEHCGRTDSEIIRAAYLSYQRWSESVVAHITIDEMYYKSGSVVRSVRCIEGVDNPEAFRKHLAKRCLFELRKPKRAKRVFPEIPKGQPQSIPEALQMECYQE